MGSLHHGCGAPSKVQAAQGRVGVAAGRAQSPKCRGTGAQSTGECFWEL